MQYRGTKSGDAGSRPTPPGCRPPHLVRRESAMIARGLVAVSLVAVILVGCGTFSRPVPTSTPVPPTPTRLEQERTALVEAWESRTRTTSGHAVLREQGIRATSPDANRLNDNVITHYECSHEFPVMGTEYARYFLPDDRFDHIDSLFTIGLHLAVCFATEEDALRAGYQRGPH
jgi:hypothetical protein